MVAGTGWLDMSDRDTLAAKITMTLTRSLDNLAEASNDKGARSVSLTKKQREKVVSRLTNALSHLCANALPQPINRQLLRRLRQYVRPLDAKGPYVLRAMIEALEDDGLVVRRVAWAELSNSVVGVDPESVSRIDFISRRSAFVKKRLAAFATIPDWERATLAVVWVILFDGLASGRDIRTVLNATVEELLEAGHGYVALRLSDDANPSNHGPRRLLIDPCAAWLFHSLPRKVVIGELITSGALGVDATKRLTKYLRGDERRRKGQSDLHTCVQAMLECIRFEAGSLVANLAKNQVKSFAVVPPVPNESAVALGSLGMPPAVCADRAALEDFTKLGEDTFKLQRIGIALTTGDAASLASLVGSLPENSILLSAVRAVDQIRRTEESRIWKPGLRDCATLVWQIFGDARVDELRTMELSDGLSDFILSAEPEVGREFLSRVVKTMQGNGSLPANIILSRIFGYGLSRLSVNTRLITEPQYVAARQRLLDAGDTDACIALLLGFRLGLRPGEIYRLHTEDVDPVARMSVTILGQVKTPAGRRALPAFELLTPEEIEFLLKHRLSLGTECEWFLPAPDPKVREAIIERSRSCLAEVCGDPALPMYRLRHSFASRWFLERYRADIETFLPEIAARHLGTQTDCPELRRSMEEGTWMYQLAYLLGHSGPGVTLLHYIHTTHYAVYVSLAHTRPALAWKEACALTGISRTKLFNGFKVDGGVINPHDLPPIPELKMP